MKKLGLLVVVSVIISFSALAGEYLMNDTEDTVYGLHVVFSEPVTVTGFGDILTVVEPIGQSMEFTFSGGEIEAWGGHWLNWEPASAVLTRSTWEKSPVSAVHTARECANTDQLYRVNVVRSGSEIMVNRHIDRNQLPFGVRYSVLLPEDFEECTLAWDLNKYVDTDGDGEPADDVDRTGTSLNLVFVENYNPTITLRVLNAAGGLLEAWQNMIRNDFLLGARIVLDGELLLTTSRIDPADVAEYHWAQRHMEKMDLAYMTENRASIESVDKDRAAAIHPSPGKYVYELIIKTTEGLPHSVRVAAWVAAEHAAQKRVGFMMADIWNECYDAGCNCMTNCSSFFTDSDAIEKLAWLRQQGFEDIAVMNQFAIGQVAPLPVILDAGRGLHVIGDTDLAMLYDQISVKHATWQTFYFDAPRGKYWGDFAQMTPKYSEEFFRVYKPNVIHEATIAEQLGLDSFTCSCYSPYLRYLDRIEVTDPLLAEELRDQWVGLINHVRDVYSGAIGLGAPTGNCIGPYISKEVDFLCKFLLDFQLGPLTPNDRGSVSGLRQAYSQYIDATLAEPHALYGKPIRYVFWANSYEGASIGTKSIEYETYDSWREEYALGGYSEEMLSGETNPAHKPDFREQVRMVEAMMPVLAERDYITEIFSQFEYWKLLNFVDFTPENILDYYNGLFTGSLQGKPAFEAYRLWASILSPNDRLVYRRLIPSIDNHRLTVGAGRLAKLLPRDWDSAPFAVLLPEDYRPSEYWHNSNVPISESTHWGDPGTAVKSIQLWLNCDVLGIRWKANSDSFLNSVFQYKLFFYSPHSDATFFVIARPRDGFVELTMRLGGIWSTLPPDLVEYVFDDDELQIYLPDLKLPSGDSINDLQDWTIEAYVVFPAPGGGESYPLVKGIRYVDLAGWSPKCP